MVCATCGQPIKSESQYPGVSNIRIWVHDYSKINTDTPILDHVAKPKK